MLAEHHKLGDMSMPRLDVISKDKEEGVALSDDEIKELCEMYSSGFYYKWEILEYFGINNLRFKRYIEIAKERNYV